MRKHVTKSRVNNFAIATLTALVLAACGGGGGGGNDAVVINPPAGGGTDGGGGGGTDTTVHVTSLAQQTEANKVYSIESATAGTVHMTLPLNASLAANDTIKVTGVSANAWTIDQNADQSIATTNLTGNVAPGAVWTARLAPKVWHWLSSDSTGQILLANEASGLLNTSVDGGATWTNGNSTANVWISSDMTPTGSRMVAVTYGNTGANGGMYISNDFGVTWTKVISSPLVNSVAGISFESVTISADGLKIAAVIQNGNVVVSQDGGATWAAGTLGGAAFTRPWRSIDSSADGTVLVAASQDASLYLSTNSGVSWTLLPVTVGLTAATENWYRVKMSADGNTIALAANTFGGAAGTGIFVTHDRGATWTKGNPLVADYTALAMSADGQTIGATLSTTGAVASRVVRSTDGGATFTALTMPAAAANWRAIAMSSDANKLAVANGTFTATAGQLYTSQGNRTSIGTLGSITAGQGDSIELQYLGGGRFSVINSSTTGAFAIR